MPYSKKHEEQKSKNYALLFALFGLVGLFFVITLLKFNTGV
jgi:hypothetical protein